LAVEHRATRRWIDGSGGEQYAVTDGGDDDFSAEGFVDETL
jgi:hypothetical protein